MASSNMDEYYKQLQTLNQQRGMTGNQALGRGMDASLAEGYMDAEMKNKQAQQQLGLQKKQLSLQQQGQAFNQNYNMQQMENQKQGQTNALIGSAIGGIANLGMQAYGMNKQSDMINQIYGQKQPQVPPIDQAQQAANEDFMSKYGTEQQPSTAQSYFDQASNWVKDSFSWLFS